MPDVGKLVIQNTSKRDSLQAIEARCQAKWHSEKVFEIDPPAYQEGVTGAEDTKKYQSSTVQWLIHT